MPMERYNVVKREHESASIPLVKPDFNSARTFATVSYCPHVFFARSA